MNSEQITSIVRQILLFVGGFAVSKGWVDSDTLIAIVGAIATLIASGWALWSRTDKNIVASAAAKVPVSDNAQASVGIAQPVSPTK